MKRILVIGDDSLWLELNRHLAGDSRAGLNETPNIDLGLRLAQMESPEVIVCRAGRDGPTLFDLARRLRERGIDTRRVLCVSEDTSGPGVDEMLRTGAAVCHPEMFVDEIEQLLESNAEEEGVRLHVLAHFELDSADSAPLERGFVNVLRLGSSRLLVESRDALAKGDKLALQFMLPRGVSGETTEREAISLRCEIQDCRDPERLRYEARVLELADEARASIDRFLERAGNRGAP